MKKEALFERSVEAVRKALDQYHEHWGTERLPFNDCIANFEATGQVSFHLVNNPELDGNGKAYKERGDEDSKPTKGQKKEDSKQAEYDEEEKEADEEDYEG